MTHEHASDPDRVPARTEPDDARGNGSAQRRIGVEVEFGGLSARDAAHVVQGLLGGEIATADAHRFELAGTCLGDIRIELDSKYVHSDADASAFEKTVRRVAGDVSGPIIPTELITDPLPDVLP